MKSKTIPIKLREVSDLELAEEFRQVAKDNASDVTKTTKMLWKEYVERNKK
jgi:hypothetical protein